MSSSLDTLDDETRARRPLSRAQFADLRRGDTIQDRRGRGRVRTVTSNAYDEGGECRVVLRSGDLARVERQRFADDCSLVESAELPQPEPAE
jgi:hypothetical protein